MPWAVLCRSSQITTFTSGKAAMDVVMVIAERADQSELI